MAHKMFPEDIVALFRIVDQFNAIGSHMQKSGMVDGRFLLMYAVWVKMNRPDVVACDCDEGDADSPDARPPMPGTVLEVTQPIREHALMLATAVENVRWFVGINNA